MRLMKSMDIPTSRTIGNCGRKGGFIVWAWKAISHEFRIDINPMTRGLAILLIRCRLCYLSAMRVETITDRLTYQDFS